MKGQLKNSLIVFLLCLFLFAFTPACFASSSGSLRLNHLDYDVTLNANGSANVVETWDIKISDTNTLFKTFELDNSKYSGITNVSVVETTGGIRKSFLQTYTLAYHVSKNYFYGLKNADGDFEIAWGVSEDDSTATRSFEISYTINNAVKNYADCSEFYWMFVNTQNTVPATKVTGNIHLPTSISSEEDLKIWAHGPLNGVIQKKNDKTVSFEVKDFKANKMLEVRVVTPTNLFFNNLNTSSTPRLSAILAEEQKWTDDANRTRLIQNIIYIVIAIAFVALFIVSIFKIIKYAKKLHHTPKVLPNQTYPYFRDFPDETASPGEIDFIYHFYSAQTNSDAISAIILDLCLKGYLSFEVSPDKKKDIWIRLTNKQYHMLPDDEKEVVQALRAVNKKYQNKDGLFNMNDFKKFFTAEPSKFKMLYDNVYTASKNAAIQKEKYEIKNETEVSVCQGKMVLYIIFAIFNLFLLPFVITYIPLIIMAIQQGILASRLRHLTQKGTDEKEQLNALKRYMLNFSSMKDKEVPELVLWEKYLVYATVFGISDKVLSQLKIVYPQMADDSYLLANHFTYLYFMSHTNHYNLVNSLNTGISGTYSSIYSSGSGRRRRILWRRRRPVVVEAGMGGR